MSKPSNEAPIRSFYLKKIEHIYFEKSMRISSPTIRKRVQKQAITVHVSRFVEYSTF